MREIHLANGGGIALVDDEDYEEAMGHRWSNTKGHARTNVTIEGVKTSMYLHRLVAARMGLTGKIDHKNRVRLDCRRENLRQYSSESQNGANRGVQKNNKLGVKGVFRYRGRCYEAQIHVHGKSIYLGRFDTIEEAQAAYWAAAQRYFGEFACRG